MMPAHEWLSLSVLFLNTAGCILYLILGIIVCVVRRRMALSGFAEGEITTEDRDRINGNRRKGVSRILQTFLVCLVCPVLGAAFFILSRIIQSIFMRKEIRLSDTIFARKKTESRNPADVEEEQDLIPLEEALTLADDRNRRKVVLGVVKEDATSSLDSLRRALNNDDSETAHYAASVLSDVLNEFRANVQKMENQLEEYQASPRKKGRALEICVRMQDYMAPYLKQHVFADLEQGGLVDSMDKAAVYLWENDRDKMKPEYFENLVNLQLELHREDRCRFWCEAVTEQYPDELVSYKCCLTYYFETKQTEQFFEKIRQLRESSLMLDADTMELIRMFSVRK